MRKSKKQKPGKKKLKSPKKLGGWWPPPDRLIQKEKTVKVTIVLSEKSVDFFKKTAKKTAVPYQAMIKRLLDIYTECYQGKNKNS